MRLKVTPNARNISRPKYLRRQLEEVLSFLRLRARNDVESTFPYSLNISSQAMTASPSDGMHESEEIPVYGYLKSKTIELGVVYCLTSS